jgi:hypothetical protein
LSVEFCLLESLFYAEDHIQKFRIRNRTIKDDWIIWLRERQFDNLLATITRQIKMNPSERAKKLVGRQKTKELVW